MKKKKIGRPKGSKTKTKKKPATKVGRAIVNIATIIKVWGSVDERFVALKILAYLDKQGLLKPT